MPGKKNAVGYAWVPLPCFRSNSFISLYLTSSENASAVVLEDASPEDARFKESETPNSDSGGTSSVTDLEPCTKFVVMEMSGRRGGAFFSMQIRAPTAASWDLPLGQSPPGWSNDPGLMATIESQLVNILIATEFNFKTSHNLF